MSGKGSSPRPFSVSQAEFGDRFDTIFGKKNKAKDIDETAQSVYNSNSTVEETDARTLDGKVQTQDSQ
jgi:hypothetical protein